MQTVRYCVTSSIMDRVSQILLEYKYPLLICLVGLVLVLGGMFKAHWVNKEVSKPSKDLSRSIVTSPGVIEIKVDLSGAVKKPGVYSMPANSRVEDVIKTGEGFSEDANQEYISKSLNLSQKISDGLKIYVPFEGESFSNPSSADAKVSINKAQEKELESLPSIGEVTAQKIISARPYSSLDELISKKAIPKSTFEKIKDLIDL